GAGREHPVRAGHAARRGDRVRSRSGGCAAEPQRLLRAPRRHPRLTEGRRDGGLGAALEPLLQPLLVLGDELARLTPRKRPDDQAEESVALKVELERDLRAALARRLHRHRADGSHRAIETTERRLPGWVVLGDLVGDRLLATRDAAQVGGARADPCRALGLARDADDLRLPLAVTLEVVDVREDVLRAAVDLDALHDRAHVYDPPAARRPSQASIGRLPASIRAWQGSARRPGRAAHPRRADAGRERTREYP